MSKVIVTLSDRDIQDLERGNKLWIPVNPNLDHSNLQGVLIRTDAGCFTNDVEADDSLNKHTI